MPESFSTNGDFGFPDLPINALSGALGYICTTRLKAFPRAYAWPALLTAASALIEQRAPKARTNLYTALVGPMHSGKSQAIEWACEVLGLEAPALMTMMSGSAEQLIRKTADAQGNARLFSPDELGHVFSKMGIENSSYSYILNTAFYKDSFEVRMGKKESANYNCVLSLIGGIVEEKFESLFDASTTGGMYDRFLFGYCPANFVYDYHPFNGAKEINKLPIYPVRINPMVWQAKSEWLKLDKTRDINPRVIEISIRAQVVANTYNGMTEVGVDDLPQIKSMVDYQTAVRRMLQPNPGENFDAKIANKLLAYLNRIPDEGFIARRKLLHQTRVLDMGINNTDRAIDTLQAMGYIEMTKVGRQTLIRAIKDEEEENEVI